MKIKQKENEAHKWKDKVRDLNGVQLVHYSVGSDTIFDRLDRLIEIIGNLVDKLPDDERLEVCDLLHRLEKVE